MRDTRSATAANVLRHANFGTLHLSCLRVAAKLRHDFDNLINASGTHWMAPRLQATACRDRHAAIRRDFVVKSKSRSLTALGKTAGFQTQGCHDRESIVKLKHINVGWGQPSLRISLLRR